MNQFTFILLFTSFVSFGQSNEDSLKSVFKNIAKTDQRFTTQKLIPDEVRNQMYAANLKLISIYIEKGNFSSTTFLKYDKKTSKEIRKASKITFIHILKYCPELILNEGFISFLEGEIKKNNFSTDLILSSLGFYYFIMTYYDDSAIVKKDFYTAKIMNHAYDALFYDAIKRWNIDLKTMAASIKIVV